MRALRRGEWAAVAAPPAVDRAVTRPRPTAGRVARQVAGSPWLLVPILLLALLLRFAGLTWDGGFHLHPDERFITTVITERILPQWPPDWGTLLQPELSPLNPRSNDPATGAPRDFAYGSLPLFVTKAVGGIMQATTGTPWTDYNHITLVGRALSALLDIGTLLVVAALARRYGRGAANLAAFLYAVCVLAIQLAHFFATDAWTTFFATAAVLLFVRAAERGRAADMAAGGALTGAAIASKASVAFLALPALVAVGVVWTAARRGAPTDDARASAAFWRGLYLGLIAFWAALLTFAVAEPYALVRLQTYLTAIGTQARMASGALDFPYTRQYVGTGPLYHLKNLVLWGMGPALGVIALSGAVWAVVRVVRLRRPVDCVLVAWVVPYLAFTLPQAVKFMRYLMPVYPVLIVFGVVLLRDVAGVRRVGRWGRRSALVRGLRGTARAVAFAVCGATLLWAVAFVSIYQQPHSRVTASRWMAANIPPGAVVATEVWDDSLPLAVPGAPRYDCVRLNPATPGQCTGYDLYTDEGSGEARLQYLARLLQQSDYIVMSSNTVWASIPRLPWRYPVTLRFYDLLFSGQLGYTTVYDGRVSPRLGPWRIDDRAADQSFSYYDHPQVLIFQKQRALSVAELRPLFADALAQTALPQRNPPGKSLLLDRPVDALPAVTDRAWGGALARRGVVAVPLYLALFELFGLIAWPLAARVFGSFPDRGWGLAKLIGWLGCAYVIWLGASLRLASFTLAWSVGALLVAAAIAALAYVRMRRALGAAARAAWPVMLAAEAVFLAGFALFLAFRLKNPDLWQTYWGGEKPFELAQINAILRSAQFPPYDPWYAGGYINYYYLGGYLEAFAMKLTGIAPEVAFNVALPVTMGLVWGAAFSVGAALWVAVRRRAARARDAIAGGVAAAVAVGLLGNFDAVGQIAAGLRAGGGWRAAAARFDFWQSTRVIPGTINEFPFFSGLWADLHAHVVALPFTILVIGIAVAVAVGMPPRDPSRKGRGTGERSPHDDGPGVTSSRFGWAGGSLLALAALVIGALYGINTWDFPTMLAIVALALLVRFRQAGQAWPRAIARAALLSVAVTAAAYALYWPFHANFQAQFLSVARTQFPSPLGAFLVLYGAPLMAIALALTFLRPAVGWLRLLAGGGLAPAVTLAGAVAVVGAVVTQRLVLVVTVPLLVLLAALFERAEGQPGRRMAYGLAAAGLGLLSVIEVVFLADDLQGGEWERMNTVFKFGYQAWTLLMLAAVALVGLVIGRWRAVPFGGRGLLTGALALAVVASLFYPVFGTAAREQWRMPPVPQNAGLDGNAWMATGSVPADQWNNSGSGEPIPFAEDLALINWLNANIVGTPVVAEASIGPYRGNGSRISSATGLPTILGWRRHEEQQRDRAPLPAREQEVRAIYTSAEPSGVQAVLDRYRVRYIVIGAVERKTKLAAGQIGAVRQGEPYASAAGLATLARMEREGALRVAWQSGETILYEVQGGWRAEGAARGA